jgi:hypothetical protein
VEHQKRALKKKLAAARRKRRQHLDRHQQFPTLLRCSHNHRRPRLLKGCNWDNHSVGKFRPS